LETTKSQHNEKLKRTYEDQEQERQRYKGHIDNLNDNLLKKSQHLEETTNKLIETEDQRQNLH